MLFFKKKKNNAELSKIIVKEGVQTSGVEGYNRLKDNILYMNADDKKKILQIESAVKGEGKTTVTCNLAVSLGLTDKKVIVVDLDFHRPRTHRLLKVEKETGIAEFMLGNAEKKDVIKKTEYKNVDCITRGAEIYNASLVLASDKFKDFIRGLKDEYDYVLLDCPPVLQVSDFIHIADVSDGVLFMVAYASTTKAQVAEAIREIKKSGSEILGTVFTMYDKKKDKTFDNGAYYGYGYGNSDE
ncbi:MAG: CpsD/CapB family tyrosine-protein kinase [Clostridia bacterium]|nr:CpsD/CapB family tyrosine-protein kinase [Clostridia bacterium]